MLLGFLAGSVIFAIVGTALKGLIRPISWATLAIASVAISSGKISDAYNAYSNALTASNPTAPKSVAAAPDASVSPSGVSLSPDANSSIATPGWQKTITKVGTQPAPIAQVPPSPQPVQPIQSAQPAQSTQTPIPDRVLSQPTGVTQPTNTASAPIVGYW